MGAPMIMGPPPDALLPRLKMMKLCVLTMMIAMLLKLIAGALLGATFNILYNSLNLILTLVVGVFLFKDDPQIGRVYQCFVTTCCQMCHDQCAGGLACLTSFAISCVFCVILDCLPGGSIETIVGVFQTLLQPGAVTQNNVYQAILLSLFCAGCAAALIAELVGAFQSCKAYSELQDMLVGAAPYSGGSWSGAGGGGGGGGTNWGGGYARNPGGAANYPTAPEAPARESRPAPGFQAFAGQGQRLGG